MSQAFFGWLPAIILPTSTMMQLHTVLLKKTVSGVNPYSWALFGVANVGTYLYTGRLLEIQAILAFGLTAILDFVIVAVVLYKNSQR